MKNILLVLLVGLILASCQKEDLGGLCVTPIGEYSNSVYLTYLGDDNIYGDAGESHCIEKDFIAFWAQSISGMKFVKWCGYSDSWNSPVSSRFSNPIVLGKYGPIGNYKELFIEAIYVPLDQQGNLNSCVEY